MVKARFDVEVNDELGAYRVILKMHGDSGKSVYAVSPGQIEDLYMEMKFQEQRGYRPIDELENGLRLYPIGNSVSPVNTPIPSRMGLMNVNPISLRPKFMELEDLYLEVKMTYERFISQPLTVGDFALACTETEMSYWTRKIHGLRDRLNVVINKWELTKLGVELAGEVAEPEDPDE